ncbi:MAG: hypothetical protein LBQ83_05335, partial [Candidatus Margulisbacteria bacterium]|nr:hypothetical protein [Candidatus Margulisiibacteriota bacterium]
AYRAQHPGLAVDQSSNVHLAYSYEPTQGGAMSLMYHMYNSAGTLQTTRNLASAAEIYTPQIGLAPNNIPLIQYVNRDSSGAQYEIRQVSKKAPAVWSAPVKVSPLTSSAGLGAVYAHMATPVLDDRPQMLWYNMTAADGATGDVYFHRAPDLVAPWIPAAPLAPVWYDRGVNSSANQEVSVTLAGSVLPVNSTQVLYDWENASDSAWIGAPAHRQTGVSDRQSVRVRIQARDAASNTSEYSPWSVYTGLADRTPPTGSSLISGLTVGSRRYVSSNAVTVQLTAADQTTGGSGISANVYLGNASPPATRAAMAASVPWTVTAGDGLKTVYTRFYDVSANYSGVYSATINVDTAAPNMPAAISTNSSDRNNLSFTWGAATDPGTEPSGVASYDIYWAQAASTPSGTLTPNKPRQSGTTITGLTCSLPSGQYGKYYLMVRAIDNAGNVGAWHPVFVFAYTGQPIYGDVFVKNKPKHQTTPKYTRSLNNDIRLEYTAAAGSTISTASVRVLNSGGAVSNNIDIVDVTNTSGSTTLNNWYLGPITDGRVTVEAYYSGLVSGVGATTNTYEDAIILDRVSPGVVSGESAPRPWTNVPGLGTYTWPHALDVTPSGVTEISGVNPVGYSYYWGTRNYTAEPGKVVNNNPNSVIGLSADTAIPGGSGTYNLTVQAVDRAGNIGNWNTLITYRYDNTTPSGTVAPNDPMVNNRNITLTLTAADTFSGIAAVYVGETQPADGAISWTSVTGGSNYSNTNYPYQLSSGNGVKTIYVRYRDAAGNVSRWYSASVDYNDGSGRSGSIKINNGAEWTNSQQVTLNFTYIPAAGSNMKVFNEDNPAQLLYDGVAVPTISNYALADLDGTRKVSVLFNDDYGNKWGTYNATIKLDRGAPYAPGGQNGNGLVINGGAEYTPSTLNNTLTLRAEDAQNAAANLEMRLWNEEGGINTGWISYQSGYYPWTLYDTGANSIATVNVVYRDPAGNTSVTYNDTIIVVNKPYLLIADGRAYTNVPTNTLTLVAPGAKEMQISNYADFPAGSSSPWLTYTNSYPGWDLLPPAGEGVKTVYARFTYLDGDYSAPVTASDTIVYDITPPSVDPADPSPPVQPDDPIYKQGSSWVLINDGAVYTLSELVDLRLSAADNNGAVYMYISNDPNDPDFANPARYEPYVPRKPWLLTSGDGLKTVYVKYMDQAGNISPAQDSISLNALNYYFRFIEPDGYHDVASDNFTVSWEDSYPGDPNAYIDLYFDTDRDNSSGLQRITPNPILVSDKINGVIWDTRSLATGKYYPYAVVSGNNGAIKVYSRYPVYVLHGDGGSVTQDPGTDPDWPGSGSPGTGTGPLPGDPPAILVLTPEIPDALPAGGIYTIYYEHKYTPSANDKAYISLWYDTGNDPLNSAARQLITASIDADLATGAFNWAIADSFPAGRYYVYATISTNHYARADYSSGWVYVSGLDHTPGDGGTGEGIWSYPNPFSPITRGEEAHIGYNVKKDGWTRVYVYNIRGERIWQTANYAYASRENIVIWNGRNARGQAAGNGIYIMILTDEGRKILSKGRLTLLD